MANIHGFGDRDNNRNIFRNYRLSPSNGENNNNEMFLLGGNDNVKPREESFYHFITNVKFIYIDIRRINLKLAKKLDLL